MRALTDVPYSKEHDTSVRGEWGVGSGEWGVLDTRMCTKASIVTFLNKQVMHSEAASTASILGRLGKCSE